MLSFGFAGFYDAEGPQLNTMSCPRCSTGKHEPKDLVAPWQKKSGRRRDVLRGRQPRQSVDAFSRTSKINLNLEEVERGYQASRMLYPTAICRPTQSDKARTAFASLAKSATQQRC